MKTALRYKRGIALAAIVAINVMVFMLREHFTNGDIERTRVKAVRSRLVFEPSVVTVGKAFVGESSGFEIRVRNLLTDAVAGITPTPSCGCVGVSMSSTRIEAGGIAILSGEFRLEAPTSLKRVSINLMANGVSVGNAVAEIGPVAFPLTVGSDEVTFCETSEGTSSVFDLSIKNETVRDCSFADVVTGDGARLYSGEQVTIRHGESVSVPVCVDELIAPVETVHSVYLRDVRRSQVLGSVRLRVRPKTPIEVLPKELKFGSVERRQLEMDPPVIRLTGDAIRKAEVVSVTLPRFLQKSVVERSSDGRTILLRTSFNSDFSGALLYGPISFVLESLGGKRWTVEILCSGSLIVRDSLQ
ncbi:MAG: hypothetical protein U0941_03580 [Planctomycetaceae bacterium]